MLARLRIFDCEFVFPNKRWLFSRNICDSLTLPAFDNRFSCNGGLVPMYLKAYRMLQTVAAASLAVAFTAGAQTPAPADSTPAPAPAAPTWSVGPMDVSGLIDGYYSYNQNRPSAAANGQSNDLYNFNDKTDQFSLSEARLTLNHDPDPVGARVDLLFGRAETLVNGPTTAGNESQFLEQAYLMLKPPKAKGFEMDFGKFVTSAGAEVIEAKDNWAYSRGILFAWAIPYYHFGLRTSLPVGKDTIGFQAVNGWNNVTKSNGGVTIGLTNALVLPKASWFVNYYTGPENANTQKGYRNLFDSTLLLTPSSKFNAYINYDYGQNRDAPVAQGGDGKLIHWQGVAFAAHVAAGGTNSLTGRYEYFKDYQGVTGQAQNLQEFTGTYEHKWAEGLLTRVEYRRDWSNLPFFHKGDTGIVDAQSTVSMAFIAFFGPKR